MIAPRARFDEITAEALVALLSGSERSCVVVDLRSPTEFEQGAIPTAVNLPLLSNDQRHIVGLTYKKEGRLPATHMALEVFAEQAPEFFDSLLALARDKTLIIHCWRGGMRSQSVAMWLRAVGVKVVLLLGGYKAFRRFVLGSLDKFARHSLIVLTGRTGVGKTDLIRQLRSQIPTIDFEGIACHRGSAFGDFAQAKPSPTQQNFENELCLAYEALSHQPKILVEIENYIGPCLVPFKLREALTCSPMILLERDFEDRVERLATEYADHWTDETTKVFLERLKLLQKSISKENIEQIGRAAAEGRLKDAVRQLLQLRYDRSYDKSIDRSMPQIIATFDLTHRFEESKAAVIKLIR